MDSTLIANGYIETLLAEAEQLAPSDRVEIVRQRIGADLHELHRAVVRVSRAHDPFPCYRGLLLSVLTVRSVATRRNPKTLRGRTWECLIEDLDAFDIKYDYVHDRPVATTTSAALDRMKSGDCLRHAMSCAVSDHRSLRAAALDLLPGLEIAHLLAPSGDLKIHFREPKRSVW